MMSVSFMFLVLEHIVIVKKILHIGIYFRFAPYDIVFIMSTNMTNSRIISFDVNDLGMSSHMLSTPVFDFHLNLYYNVVVIYKRFYCSPLIKPSNKKELL